MAHLKADFQLGFWDRLRLLFGGRIFFRAEVDGYSELDVGGHRITMDIVSRRRLNRASLGARHPAERQDALMVCKCVGGKRVPDSNCGEVLCHREPLDG